MMSVVGKESQGLTAWESEREACVSPSLECVPIFLYSRAGPLMGFNKTPFSLMIELIASLLSEA